MAWDVRSEATGTGSRADQIRTAWEPFVRAAADAAAQQRQVTLRRSDLLALGDLVGDSDLTRRGHPLLPYWMARTTLAGALDHLLQWQSHSPAARVMGGEMSVDSVADLETGQVYVVRTHLAGVSCRPARSSGSVARFSFEAHIQRAGDLTDPRPDLAHVELQGLILDPALPPDPTADMR